MVLAYHQLEGVINVIVIVTNITIIIISLLALGQQLCSVPTLYCHAHRLCTTGMMPF